MKTKYDAGNGNRFVRKLVRFGKKIGVSQEELRRLFIQHMFPDAAEPELCPTTTNTLAYHFLRQHDEE